MSELKRAKEELGELFIVGFMGKTLSPTTTQFLEKAGIGGILYFKHNFENPEQVTRLSAQIQAVAKKRNQPPTWISVDQEGGRVQRFKGDGKPGNFLPLPIAAKVAQKGTPEDAKKIAEIQAMELASVGVNVNFAPVADILTNPKNPVIGDRAYGTETSEVSSFVRAVVEGHLNHGVEPCVKHFPGHGDTELDSHFALPSVNTDLETLRSREFLPFQEGFQAGCHWVMTAHVLIPSIDPEKPATLSEKSIRGILRNDLRFQGLIVSDDLQMQAVTDHYGADLAPRLALLAGCDLLIYRSEEVGQIAYESLLRDLETGALPPALILEASARSKARKKQFLKTAPKLLTNGLGSPEHAALIQNFL